MIESFIYIILAAIGLGSLIFIHELAHYWVARKVGMKVETFSIGFGKSIYSWNWQGVKWQVGWLPFGGYVKILGMEPSDDEEEEPLPGGFYSRPPIDRIKVALAGPVVNLLFALLAFSCIWAAGGRSKSFYEFTDMIGWVDPQSGLYTAGVRPGDEVTFYGTENYTGAKDHFFAPTTADETLVVKGYHVNYRTGDKTPFSEKVKVYPSPLVLDNGIRTAGILSPASYLIYKSLGENAFIDPFAEGNPMHGSGLVPGDQIVWVDGERVFSLSQLRHVLNDGKVLVTLQREGRIILRRVPRVPIDELKLETETKEELIDWQYEAGLQGKKLQNLYVLPYNLSPENIVEAKYRFIDQDTSREIFPKHLFSSVDKPLKTGDKILAVNGEQVKHAYQLFEKIQNRKVNVVVQRDTHMPTAVNWRQAQDYLEKSAPQQDLDMIASTIGTNNLARSSGNLHLLNLVSPVTQGRFNLSDDKRALLEHELSAEKKRIAVIEDPEKRSMAMQLFEKNQNTLMLGLPLQDRKVIFNPDPLEQFGLVFTEIWRTLGALLSGNLNPKWVSGPIGIVQTVQESWSVSSLEVLFWLGAISLNLGVLNLLPIPVLDGGYIAIFLCEMITGRKLKKKTMERLIIPFVVLVVGFLFYVTYNDVSRIFSQLIRM